MKMLLPYLLLVTFYGSPLHEHMWKKDWATISSSPYDGVAVRLVGAYDATLLDHDQLLDELKRVKEESGKDVWPWIFLNRMIGVKKESDKYKQIPAKDRNHFSDIRGIDIFDEACAREAFLDNWRVALRLSNEIGAPGVVFDIESYNNYKIYDIRELAQKYSMTPDEVIVGLKEVGATMADIATKEYPKVVVWTLFTGLGENNFKESGYSYSVSYILLGFLERCETEKYGMKLIAGGAVSLGYCSSSPERLKQKMIRRKLNYARYLEVFQENLALGGTIAPWVDAVRKEGWVKEGECGKCDVKNLDGFKPYFSTLYSEYDYLWVYAAQKAHYNPFDTSDVPSMTPLIKKWFKSEERK